MRFVMNMGAPVVTDDQATFVFPSQLIYNTADTGDHDGAGVPFNPSIPVTRTPPKMVKVPCAVEYFDAEGVMTDFGMIAASRAQVTLLDEDYAKVEGCVAVILAGERFVYQKTEFPTGLFDVGLYTMHFTAENDT